MRSNPLSGSLGVIDRVEAALDSGRGELVSSLPRLSLSKILLEGSFAGRHDRLLRGVFYADAGLEHEYRSRSRSKNPTRPLQTILRGGLRRGGPLSAVS